MTLEQRVSHLEKVVVTLSSQLQKNEDTAPLRAVDVLYLMTVIKGGQLRYKRLTGDILIPLES